jgi:MFS family permease
MQDELHLSATELGVLFTAFYYGYVLAMAPVGWLAERFGAQLVLAIGVAVWSIATILTGLAASFAGLLALRLVLGIGESAAFPCASKLLANAVDVKHLGVANGVMSFGYLLGPAVGTLAGGLLMASFGWRPAFLVLGVLSLTWLWPWRSVVIEHPVRTSSAIDASPTLPQILRQRALWGAALGLFTANYAFYFILAWLPFYLVKVRGFSAGSMAWLASWAYLLNALSALLSGWATDRWIRAGHGANGIYKGIMVLNHAGAIVCMAGVLLLPRTGSLLALFAYEILAGVASPGLFAIPQIFAGPRAAGRWVGVHNTIGGIAGFVAPMVTGILVDRTGNFALAFILAGAVSAFGLLGWLVMLPRIAPIEWRPVGAP